MLERFLSSPITWHHVAINKTEMFSTDSIETVRAWLPTVLKGELIV